MDPLDDLEAVLGRNHGDAGEAGDEVLQRDSALLCLIAQLQRAELCRIAFWETESHTHKRTVRIQWSFHLPQNETKKCKNYCIINVRDSSTFTLRVI